MGAGIVEAFLQYPAIQKRRESYTGTLVRQIPGKNTVLTYHGSTDVFVPDSFRILGSTVEQPRGNQYPLVSRWKLSGSHWLIPIISCRRSNYRID